MILLVISFFQASVVSVKNADTYQKRCDYLNNLGYNVSECAEISSFLIFDYLDAEFVYYNNLQKEAGYDISEFSGRKLQRYSYNLKKQPICVSILVYNGRIVGGDIYNNASITHYALNGY